MRKYIILLFLVCIIIVNGCVSYTNQVINFSQTKSLELDSIAVPPLLPFVTRLFIANDMLVPYQQKNNTLFSFWKLSWNGVSQICYALNKKLDVFIISSRCHT
jgi:hypothetical protein